MEIKDYTALVKNWDYPVMNNEPFSVIWIPAIDIDEANKIGEMMIEEGFIGVIEGMYIWYDKKIKKQSILPEVREKYYEMLFEKFQEKIKKEKK